MKSSLTYVGQVIFQVGFAQQIPAQNETATTGDGLMTHSCARWRGKQKKGIFVVSIIELAPSNLLTNHENIIGNFDRDGNRSHEFEFISHYIVCLPELLSYKRSPTKRLSSSSTIY